MKLQPEKALSAQVVLVSGEESALRKRALQELLDAAEVQRDDFDLQGFDGDSDPQDWLASAGTAPFLAQRRTVVVRQLLRADLDVAKGLGWKHLPASALLILVADEESGDEDKQRKLKSLRTAWEKLVSSVGGHVVRCDVRPNELSDLVKEEAKKLDKTLTSAAQMTLAEMTAGSVSRAIEELPKLALYAGAEKTIQEADVRALVVPSREWSVYRLVDAAINGETAEALRQLRILVGSSTRAEEAAMRNILPQLSRTLRLAWQARACIEARTTPDAASDTVRASFLSKPNLANESDFSKSKAMRLAKTLTLPQIAHMLELVSDCDARLKGMLPSFSAMETLEQTILKLVDAARPRVAVR